MGRSGIAPQLRVPLCESATLTDADARHTHDFSVPGMRLSSWQAALPSPRPQESCHAEREPGEAPAPAEPTQTRQGPAAPGRDEAVAPPRAGTKPGEPLPRHGGHRGAATAGGQAVLWQRPLCLGHVCSSGARTIRISCFSGAVIAHPMPFSSPGKCQDFTSLRSS